MSETDVSTLNLSCGDAERHLGITYRQLEQAEDLVAARFAGRYAVVGECWEFNGYRIKGGYGQIHIGRRKRLVHRESLALTLGRPLTEDALHHCDNPPCFRPSHLYEGTPADNAADRGARGRTATRERHGKTQLAPGQVREILTRYRPGLNRWDRGNGNALAAEFGVTKAYITMVAKNGHWSLHDGKPESVQRVNRLIKAGFSPLVSATFARDKWPRGEIAPGIVIEVAP